MHSAATFIAAPLFPPRPRRPLCPSPRTPTLLPTRLRRLPCASLSHNSNTNNGHHSQPAHCSYPSRIVLLTVLAAVAVMPADPSILADTHPPACRAASLPPLLDEDLATPGDPVRPKFFDESLLYPDPSSLQGETISSPPIQSTATYEDYLRVLQLPEIDLLHEFRVYARNALFAGIPVAIFSTLSALYFRSSPRITLPAVYDVDALQRYFSLRLDLVLLRLIQFAQEATLFACGLLSDRVADATDSLLVRTKSRNALWRSIRVSHRDRHRAVALRDTITRLGPAMIKLGQAVASRPDLVSAAVVRELQPLQDDVLAVFPSKQAFQVIRDELGASVESIFDDLDPEPVAGASLGMVFKGRVDGTAVAVKVQRPEVATSLALDCYIVRSIASAASAVFGLRTDWRAAVDEYASRLFEELDYTNELKNMTKFREMYGKVKDIYLPLAFPEYSSQRVLVTEWVDGDKLIDDNAKVRQQDLGLVETGIRFALMQILDKGFLHADMHNGNMLRTKSGYLAYIDFGLVSEVPEYVRESLVCALVHLIHGEYSLLAECFAGLELMRSDDVQVELPVLAEALREAFEPAGSTDPDGTGVGRFRDFSLVGVATKLLLLGTRFPFVFRDYFLNNLRCLGMLEGLAVNADPNFSVLSVVYPYIVKKMLLGTSPRYRQALESLVIDSYGRMRWSRIDQLLYDVGATAATAKIGATDSVFGRGMWNVVDFVADDNENDTTVDSSATVDTDTPNATTGDESVSNNDDESVRYNDDDSVSNDDDERERNDDNNDSNNGTGAIRPLTKMVRHGNAQQSARLVVRLLMSDSGRFLRRYIVQQYLLNVEIDWRRKVDRKLAGSGGSVGDDMTMPLVNATSTVWQDAATRWLALQATARELTDDEARVRTREFFRWTPLMQKVVVIMRLFPGAVVPWFRTVVGLVSYLVLRCAQRWRGERRTTVTTETATETATMTVVVAASSTKIMSNSTPSAVSASTVEGQEQEQREDMASMKGIFATEEVKDEDRRAAISAATEEWRPLESSFARRTRETNQRVMS